MKRNSLKSGFKKIIPSPVRSYLRGIHYGWHGNYKSWKEAESKCTGYESGAILNAVRDSLIKVKRGEAVYERDSVLFDEIQYSFPVLSTLMWISAINRGHLNIIDFGGSLGSTYFQNRYFLDKLNSVKWCIVEQPAFVLAGKESFEDERLHFYDTIEECMAKHRIDAILFSSILQYLEKPFELIDRVILKDIPYIIIDRTPFIKGHDRITVQRVPPRIYSASYPCWFFEEKKFLQKFAADYRKIMEFQALDSANIKSEFKGFLFEKNKMPD